MDNHVKKTADDLINLLLHKSPAIPALKPESSRQALIQLTQVLERDNLPTIVPVQPAILQQLPTKSITDIISKGAVKQNTTLSTLPILSPSTTSTIIHIRNTTSKGEKARLITTSTSISKSSQQTLDALVLQYKKLDKMNAVPKPIVKKLPPLPPHLKDNIIKYNIPCPKRKPRAKRSPPIQLPLIHRHFTRSKTYSFDAPIKSWAVKELVAQHMASKIFHIFDTTGHKESLDSLLKVSHSTT